MGGSIAAASYPELVSTRPGDVVLEIEWAVWPALAVEVKRCWGWLGGVA